MNLIALAIPLFFLGMGVEAWVALKRKRALFRLGDVIADLGCGVGQQLVTGFYAAALLGAYEWLYQHGRLVTWPTWAGWVGAFLGVEVAYYWWHRLSHEVNLLWAAHVVHHQSEDYNLAVALRQSVTTSLSSFPFFAVLAVLGVPTLPFAVLNSLTTLYQFWIHTELVPKLGVLEKVLNTPALHRVHHAVNPQYLDKNHGATFAVWDRLFGTYAPEEERCIYGTTTPLRSFNPLWAQLEGFARLLRMSRAAPSVGQALAVWFRSPAWKPDWWREDEPPPLDARPVYRASVAPGRTRYVLVQLSVLLAATFCDVMWGAALALPQQVVVATVILLGLWSMSALVESKAFAPKLEAGRLVATLASAAWLLLG
ncbi:MAG: sterol desaturase family protein [Myxococcaceae bacterium]|nr:sterol desaturase family protein [Myxococcaceae bacterium]